MSNLGKLWFDVDVNLDELKSKLSRGNQDILDALNVKVPIDAKSLEGLASTTKKAADESERKAKAENDAAKAAENQAQATKKTADESEKVAQAQRIISNRFDKLKANAELLQKTMENIGSKSERLNIDTSVLNAAKEDVKSFVNSLNLISGKNITQGDLSEFWSILGKIRAQYKDVIAEAEKFNKTTEKGTAKADGSIKKLGMAFNELKGYMKANGGSEEMKRLQTEIQGAIQKIRQLMNAGDFKGAVSVFERMSGSIRQAKTATNEYEKSKRQAEAANNRLSDSERRLARDVQGSTDALRGQSSVLSDLKTMVTQYLSVWGAKSFIDNIIDIGGQLEKQRISMGAIIGDTARANELFEQIKDMAVKSPFGVVELDQYSKQLAAYGIEQSKLFDMTKRLADISAGAGQDIGRLALALGHVKSATYLTGITLRQFSMNNIPMLKMLADYYTEVEKRAVSTAEVQKRISKRQVSYEDVIEQIKRMTNEGGQFYNMQEKISESLSARFKNLKDSLDIMYGEMAESGVGDLLKDLAAVLTDLSRRWKELMPILVMAGTLWAGYRIKLMAINKAVAAHSAKTKALTASQRWLNMEVQKGALNFTIFGHKITWFTRQWASLRLAMSGVAATLRSLLPSFGSIAAFAGISAVVEIWQKHNLEVEKARELADQLFDRTEEGIKNVKNLLDETSMSFVDEMGKASDAFGRVKGELVFKPASEIDNGTMVHDMELWENFIREYAATPNRLLKEVYEVNEANNKAVHSLAEQYELLGKNAIIVANSLPLMTVVGDALAEAIEDADGGWFDDNILTDLKEYENAYKTFQGYATDLYEEHRRETKAALAAARSDAAFAAALDEAGISIDNYTGQLFELAKNQDKYTEAMQRFGDVWTDEVSIMGPWYEDLFQTGKLGISEANLETELEQAMERMKSTLEGQGIDVTDLTPAYKQAVTKSLTDMMTKAGLSVDAVKNKVWELVKTEWDVELDINEVEATAKTSAIQEELDKLVGGEFHIDIGTSSDIFETIDNIRKGYNAAKKQLERAKPLLIKLGVSPVGLAKMGDDEIDKLADGNIFKQMMLKALRGAQQKVDDALKASEELDFDLNTESENRKEESAAKKNAKKSAERRQKEYDLELKQREERRKQLQEADTAEIEATIAAIVDGGQRERAERSNQYRLALQQIDNEEEEMKKKIVEAMKSRWEAEHNEDDTAKWADTETAQDVLKNGYANIKLEEAQEKKLKEMRKKAEAEYERDVKERVRQEEDANREAVNSYLRQFGDYAQKKQAIYEDSNAKICKEEEVLSRALTDEERAASNARIATIKAETKEQIDELEIRYGEMKSYMADLFEDIADKSTGEMQRVIYKYDALLKFLNNKGVSREDLLGLGFTEREIEHALDEVRTKGTETLKNISDGVKSMKKELGGASPWLKFVGDIEKARKKIADTRKALAVWASPEYQEQNPNAPKPKMGEAYGVAISNIGSAVKDVLPDLETLSTALVNIFGIDDSSMKQAIETMRGLGTMAEGVGKVMQNKMDISGYISILSGIGNIVSNIFGNDEEEKQRRRELIVERLNNRISALSDNVSKLNDTMEKSYGVEAQQLAAQAREALSKKQQTMLNGLRGDGLLSGLSSQGFGGSTTAVMLRNLAESMRDAYGLAGSDFALGGVTFKELFDSNSAEDLAKALADMRENHYDWWADLLAYADESEKAWLEGLADTWNEAADIMDRERERVLGTTLENVVSDMLSSLYDLANGTEDVTEIVAENWQKMMNKMIVDSLFATKLKKALEGWMKEWEDAYNSGNFTWSADGTLSYQKTISKEEEDRLRASYNSIWSEISSEVEALREIGVLVDAVGDATDTVANSFDNLRDSWTSTLTDMSATTADFKQQILDTMFEDLVNKFVLGIPVTINTTEGEQSFDDFAAYLENWTKRYRDIMEDATLSDDERTAALTRLADEQAAVRDELVKTTEVLANSIGMNKEFSNALDDLGDTLVDGLLDMEKDAEQMGKEIGQALVKEMLKEMLASEAYATQTEAIRVMWQKILKGEDTEHTIDNVLAEINALITQMAQDENLSKLIAQYNEWGKVIEDLKSSFEDVRDTMLDSLTDMSQSADDFRKTIEKTMVKDLISKQLDEMEIEVSRGFDEFGQEMIAVFEGFDAYAKDWNERYLKAIAAGDTALTDQLIKEMVSVCEDAVKNAEELRKRLEEITADTTFTGLKDSFVSALTDMTSTAEDWAQEMRKTLAQKLIETAIVPRLIVPLLKTAQDALDNAIEKAKSTNAEGETIYDWKKILGDEALTASISDIEQKYPELKSVIEQILSLSGVKTDFSNSLDNLGDTILDTLLDVEKDAEDMGKEIGQTLIREMLEEMLKTGAYADQIAAFRDIWQKILTSDNGTWIDERGLTWTLESLLTAIEQMGNEMANNPMFDTLIDKFNAFGKTATEGFSDLRGAFVDSLLDMENDAESFGKKIGETMIRQMIDAYIDSKYGALMKQYSEEWGAALESGNTQALENIKQKVIDLYKTISDPNDVELQGLIDAIRTIEEEADETFSGMSDSWVSALMDMEGTAEEWAENVGKAIAEKIVKEMVVPTLIQPLLDDLQKAMNAAMSADGATWQTVIDAALPHIDMITDRYRELQPVVEQILNSLGIFRETVEDVEEEIEYALDNMRSEFVSSLMDMDETAESWGRKISETLARAFIDKFVLGEKFDQQMEAWQQQFESITTSGLSEDERMRQLKQLRDAIAAAKDGYVEQSMAIQELLGLNTAADQSATANIADKITYEQADELLGINMAQEMTLEQILATLRGGAVLPSAYALGTTAGSQDALNQQILATLDSMRTATQPVGTSTDIFNRLGYTNEYLRAIRDSNDAMLSQFGNVLTQINSKLSRL